MLNRKFKLKGGAEELLLQEYHLFTQFLLYLLQFVLHF